MRFNASSVGTVCALLASVAACGDNIVASEGRDAAITIDADRVDARGIDAPRAAPTVIANRPLSGATGVPRNDTASVTFSEPMEHATLNTSTFTLTFGVPAVSILGTVVATSTEAVFWPATQLASNVTYTATISAGAKSAAGVALSAPYQWSFTTGTTVGAGLAVNLGTARDFVLLAKSGITNVPTSSITGDLGVSPIAGTAITGLGLMMDPSGTFATSSQVTGRVYAADYAPPTPAKLTTAITDMETAFADAAARAPDVNNLGSGSIGSVTLAPGVYRWSTGLLIPTDVTLSGTSDDVWIFQIAGDLGVADGVRILLAGGALSKHVFWQCDGAVTAGVGTHFEGNVLSRTSAIFDTGSSLNGRLLTQTAVTIRGAAITRPAL